MTDSKMRPVGSEALYGKGEKPPQPCGPPRLLSIEPGPRCVTVKFEPVVCKALGPGAPQSYVVRVLDGERVVREVGDVKCSGCTVRGLLAGMPYTISLASKNGGGVGPFSKPSATFVTPGPRKLDILNESKARLRAEQPHLYANLYLTVTEEQTSASRSPWNITVVPGVKRAVISFTSAASSSKASYALRLTNCKSGLVKEVSGFTSVPYTAHSLYAWEPYTVAVAVKVDGHLGPFSHPSKPFVPLAAAEDNKSKN